jgi:cyclopropane-fatty-acyl-phospholipid synthase
MIQIVYGLGEIGWTGCTMFWTNVCIHLVDSFLFSTYRHTVFEHMKNYNDLLEKVHGFLKPEGKLFVHIFTHKDYAYQFEE